MLLFQNEESHAQKMLNTTFDMIPSFEQSFKLTQEDQISSSIEDNSWLQPKNSVQPRVQSAELNIVSQPYNPDMIDLDIVQNHMNESYFLQKEKEYLVDGRKPVLSFQQYEQFEQQLQKESSSKQKGETLTKNVKDSSQSLFSASLPIQNAWNYKMKSNQAKQNSVTDIFNSKKYQINMKVHQIEKQPTKQNIWKKKLGDAWYDALGGQYNNYDTTHQYWNDVNWNNDNSNLQTKTNSNSIFQFDQNPLFNKFSSQQLSEFEKARTFFSNMENDKSQSNLNEHYQAEYSNKQIPKSKEQAKKNDQIYYLKSDGGDNNNEDKDLPRKKKKIGLRSEDFNLKLGKVIDTLNSDYPLLFVKPLDYNIYIDEIEVTDPTGIAFQGKKTYKNLFTILRFFAKTVFSGQSITYKIHYDPWDQAVRVIWHVVIYNRIPGLGSPLYVDGISKYFLNWEGDIYRHEVNRIVVNGIPQEPPFIKFFDIQWLTNPDLVPIPGAVPT